MGRERTRLQQDGGLGRTEQKIYALLAETRDAWLTSGQTRNMFRQGTIILVSQVHTHRHARTRARISPMHILKVNSRSGLFVTSRFSPAAMIVVSFGDWNDTKPSRHSLGICRDNTYILKSTHRKGWHSCITEVNITPKACMWLTSVSMLLQCPT